MKLLRKYISILIEGYQEDQNELIKKYPQHENQIQRMNPKMIAWFIKRFGNRPSIEEIHPFEDCIETVKQYDSKSSGLNQKYTTNLDFKELVNNTFPAKKWNTPAEYLTISVDDMISIMRLSERKKVRVKIDDTQPDRSDYIGKFGPWNLWMPTTQENSIKIAGYDPETLESYTTWCTARVTSSNLFYSYAGRGIILYYIIKDNPKNNTDWLSIGFINGEMVFRGAGSESVDGKNNGLTNKKLMSILGANYSSIVETMKNKTKEIEGEHPAKKKMQEAAENISVYKELIKGLGKKDASELKVLIGQQQNISDEVFKEVFSDDTIRIKVAYYDDLNPKTLFKLADYNSEELRTIIASHHNVTPQILEKIARSSHRMPPVLQNVAKNKKTPQYVLEDLYEHYISVHNTTYSGFSINDVFAGDIEIAVLKGLSGNRSTPKYILSIIQELLDQVKLVIKDHNDNLTTWKLEYENETIKSIINDIQISIASNYSTPAKIIQKLFFDENRLVATYARMNPNVPSDVLHELALHEDFRVRAEIAQNTNISRETLTILANDPIPRVRESAAHQVDYMSKDLQEKLAMDPDEHVVYSVINWTKNPKLLDIIMYNDDESKYAESILNNYYITNEQVEAYTDSSTASIRELAYEILQKRGIEPVREYDEYDEEEDDEMF